MNSRLLLPVPALLLALGLTGCATTITYVPTNDNVQMSLTKARRVLAKERFTIIDNKTLHIDGAFVRVWIKDGIKSLTIPLKDIKVSSGREGMMYNSYTVLQVPGYSRVVKDNARQIAEAIFVVQREAAKNGFAPPAKSEDALFEEAATAYLAAETRPELNEDARRLKAQAEDALHEKRFEDVVDAYGEALTIAPWWPAGHYNRALVLSELREFPEAIVEMKRYLRLAPDAANAAAAQEAIYKWEAKAPKGKKA